MSKQYTKREKRYFSLRWKWSLAISLLIFCCFSLFSFLVYQTSMTLLQEHEKQTAIKIADRIITSLKTDSSELTEDEIYHQLPVLEENYEQTTPSSNRGFLEFFSDDIDVGIYNIYGIKQWHTADYPLNYRPITEDITETVKINDKTGVLVQKIILNNKNQKVGYLQVFYELATFNQIRAKFLNSFLLFAFIILVLSMLIGFGISTYFTKPLRSMIQSIQAVKKDPQASVRMPKLQSKDELSELSDVFNEMLDRMQRFIDQQQQFVEDVSHELRTPVAIIEGHLKMLNRWGKQDPAILEESLEASLQEITRMKSLVQEMLDLSRAEQVEVQYANNYTDAKEVVRQTYNNFKILYPDFVFTLDDDLPDEVLLNMYRNHFEQILIIILDNAVKYSTRRKEVHLSTSLSNRDLDIAIQDFGEGIPAKDLDQIFNRFYRVDKARSRDKGGNGLGLSIAQKLVENYHGTISVESVAGYGTVFRIVFPIVSTDKQEKLLSDKVSKVKIKKDTLSKDIINKKQPK